MGGSFLGRRVRGATRLGANERIPERAIACEIAIERGARDAQDASRVGKAPLRALEREPNPAAVLERFRVAQPAKIGHAAPLLGHASARRRGRGSVTGIHVPDCT
jgi:hypothetical protein